MTTAESQTEKDERRSGLEFFVAGTPAPGGSKNAFAIPNRRTGGYMTRANGYPIISVTDAGGKRTKDWRKVCAIVGRQAMAGRLLFAEPLRVSMHFRIARPKSHYRTGANAHLLRSDAPSLPTVKPDLTKLLRSTEDALTGIVWVDDVQIVGSYQSKRYCCDGEESGAVVRIERGHE